MTSEEMLTCDILRHWWKGAFWQYVDNTEASRAKRPDATSLATSDLLICNSAFGIAFHKAVGNLTEICRLIRKRAHNLNQTGMCIDSRAPPPSDQRECRFSNTIVRERWVDRHLSFVRTAIPNSNMALSSREKRILGKMP
jgi:hypothetical protein